MTSTRSSTATGEIDLSNAHAVKSAVLSLTTHPGVTSVALDLSGVTFLDSTGISALVSCQRRLMADGIAFGIVGASGAPRRVLELTNVLGALTTQPAEHTAGRTNIGQESNASR